MADMVWNGLLRACFCDSLCIHDLRSRSATVFASVLLFQIGNIKHSFKSHVQERRQFVRIAFRVMIMGNGRGARIDESVINFSDDGVVRYPNPSFFTAQV
jgi:hypothetical protein